MGEPNASPVPFGSNEIRLNGRQWLAVVLLVGLVIGALPSLWLKWERITFSESYRVPYELSKDYWLYKTFLEHVDEPNSVYLVGDSVVWGEYVSKDGTLSAFLNKQGGKDLAFVNAGVNGLFPLALEGLVQHYGKAMRQRRVLLHCNLLWMTSAEVDLSSEKEQRFNHPRLVAQFSPQIPSYRASVDERLGVVMGRSIPFLGFVRHLQNVYFDQKGLYQWTLADDGDYPPSYPNIYRLPWTAIHFEVPGEALKDPDRGIESDRHKAWSTTGEGTQEFDWVSLDKSLQWAAFQRLVNLLLRRDNSLLVVVGPLNRHIISDENQSLFDERVVRVERWLKERKLPYLLPEVLAFDLYGDASHPLTEGYRQMAETLWSEPLFQTWLRGKDVSLDEGL